MSNQAEYPVIYFGKIPSRGDFVRSNGEPQLIQTMDRWLTQAIELMTVDARWKQIYDQASPTRFAFLGVKSRNALVGHLIPSRDKSGRRFPFLTATSIPVHAPMAFVARSPILMAPIWSHLEKMASQVCVSSEPTALSELDNSVIGAGGDLNTTESAYQHFLDQNSLSSLYSLLVQTGWSGDLRHIFLAMGLLLQPVLVSGANHLEVGLQLPLPSDPLFQPLVATLWLDLITRFLHHGDFEIVIFPQNAGHGHPSRLLIGFRGGTPADLQAVWDTQLGSQTFLDLSNSPWVDEQAHLDQSVKKMSSYLDQPQLSLQRAVTTFVEVFLGE